MIKSLSNELNLRLASETESIKTLYFGGGTPSLLSHDDWRILVETCALYFSISDLQEFTIEANPDDINIENLSLWKNLGVNRLSIGVQSFRTEDLEWMNRAHSAEESLKSINLAQQFGFKNLNIDLMYGLPNQSEEVWKTQIQTAAKLGVSHISAYCLTVEDRTALKTKVNLGDLVIPDDELVEAQFDILIETLAHYGFEQYEISNFAKAGCEAIHNSNYWLGEKYIGIGPSAHGFDGKSRYWNISNNHQYIKSLANNQLPQTVELLSNKDKFNELILTGLRTKWGVQLTDLEHLIPFDKDYSARVQNYLQWGVLENNDGKIRLSQKARIKADFYASSLFR